MLNPSVLKIVEPFLPVVGFPLFTSPTASNIILPKLIYWENSVMLKAFKIIVVLSVLPWV